MGAAIVRTARIRSEGTRNLVSAAIAAGARRLVAQSIAWAYAPGAEPHTETDPLDAVAEGESGINMQGVIALEDLTLKSPPLQGVVLRYGHLYGPGTPFDQPSGSTPVHVDAAAYAALLAIDHGEPGIYNIAQLNRTVATEKARAELGWTPDFRLRWCQACPTPDRAIYWSGRRAATARPVAPIAIRRGRSDRGAFAWLREANGGK
jgi:hypothetical protein